MQPHYAASGHLIYSEGGNLFAAPFDPERLEITGQVVAVVKGVMESAVTGGAQYSLSSTGTLAYVQGSVVSAHRTLVWVDRKGTERIVLP